MPTFSLSTILGAAVAVASVLATTWPQYHLLALVAGALTAVVMPEHAPPAAKPTLP